MHDPLRDERREALIDAALRLAERVGWDRVLLHELADATGLTLAELATYFAHKDALAEAWFDRADRRLLAVAQTPGWAALDVPQRLHAALFAWFDALAPHRRTCRAMLGYKLQPEHLHLQVLGALRVSRTVQWIREVARLPATGWRREAEEAALTALYLAAFVHWLRDDTPGAGATRDFVTRWLARADGLARRLPGAA
jgi:AcrR family transcriptional regulator